MGKSLRLGRIFGIPIEINVTWLVIFLLLTVLLANRFDSLLLRWPVYQQWIVAIITVGLFFMSVLAHELSHSLVALSRGIHVTGITLFIFGGVSHLASEPRRPSEEEEFLRHIRGGSTDQPGPRRDCGRGPGLGQPGQLDLAHQVRLMPRRWKWWPSCWHGAISRLARFST